MGFLLALAGCGKGGDSKAKGGHPLPAPLVAKCSPGRPGGRLVIATAQGPKTFNPLFAGDDGSETITRLLFGSLVTLNLSAQEISPGLAESWQAGPDGKTWTFKLREGLRWSDGQPLSAQDVVFTWNEIMYNPQLNRSTYNLFRADGRNFEVTNLDDRTVRVVTPEVFAPFLEFFGTVAILPRHVLQDAVRGQRFPLVYGLNTPPERLVGCGPFRIEEVRAGKYTLLERNPEYWVVDSQGRRLPYFGEVMFLAGSGPDADLRLFSQGKSDVFEAGRPQNFAFLKQAATQRSARLIDVGVGSERDFIWFNQNTGTNAAGRPLVNPVKLKWFRNKKFRQAVSCALNRERLVREVYGGRAQPMYSFISAENPKWDNPDVAHWSYDPARARALLAEIGLRPRQSDGSLVDESANPVEVLFSFYAGNAYREKSAALIQDDLQKVGIKLVSAPLDSQALITKVNATFDYECAMMGLGGGAIDPASQMNVLRSSEDLHQWYPFQATPSTEWEARIDALMDAQMRTLDFTQRKKEFSEVQAILADELPMIYTVSPISCAAIRSDVGNLRPSVLTPYRLTWNLEELFFQR